jgi:formylglycine-generating enzyme required for sulfatase activity
VLPRLALAVAVSAACERTRTAVLVRIETDLTSGATGEVKGVRVRVGSGSGITAGWRHDTAYPLHRGGSGSFALPLKVLVMPLDDDPARVVTVEAWVCDNPGCPVAAQPLVEQRAIFSFVAGEQRELLMFLSDVCRGMRCKSPLETCRGRVPGCQSARVEASLLPVAGQSPPQDAAPLSDVPRDDAAVDVSDAAARCNGATCLSNERCCDGSCVDVQSNNLQCGACMAPCGPRQTCRDGQCHCPEGMDVCNGLCADRMTDTENCGACGRRCQGAESCVAGNCTCADRGPESLERLCGAQCIRSAADTENCGGCGRQCIAGGRCVAGRCECRESEGLCGPICVDGRYDATHCGMCNNDCGAGRACQDGGCDSPTVLFAPRTCPAMTEICRARTIAGATFTLGAAAVAGATPTRAGITVGEFAIDAHEVTVARFRQYWDRGHSGIGGRRVVYPGGELPVVGDVHPPTPSNRAPQCNWSVSAGLREYYPLNCVDWVTAQSFCVWDGGRLPTEAEWELAARGAAGRRFPWGTEDRAGAACVSDGDGDGGVSRSGTCSVEVGSFMIGASPDGVWHLLGNVAEFTADAYEPYGDMRCWGDMPRMNPLCLPRDMSPGAERTVRGYAWNDRGPFHAASRGGAPPTSSPSIGFRCAHPVRAM